MNWFDVQYMIGERFDKVERDARDAWKYADFRRRRRGKDGDRDRGSGKASGAAYRSEVETNRK